MTRTVLGRAAVVGAVAFLTACGGGSKDTTGGNDGGNTNPGNDGGTTNPGNDGGTTNPTGVTCSTGTLFAGDPVYTGDNTARPTSGTGVLADPPLQWQSLVFAGTHLYTRQEGEIWSVDLSASSLVETKIAGTNPADTSAYPFHANNVACSSATFTQLRGLAALSDGSLVATDLFANAVVHITNPDNASTCMVTVLAGPNADVTIDPNMPSTYPAQGNMNGTGTAATFNNLHGAIGDAAGNAYVVDNTSSDGGGAWMLRKVTSGGVVTTVLTMPSNDPPTGPETLENFAYVGTTLYAASRNADNQGYVISIDTTAGTTKTIAGGDGSAWDPLDSATSPDTSGIASDGTGLYVAGAGYVWYVTTAGKVGLVAGTGTNIDNFTSGYDPKASQPALMLELPTVLGSADQSGTSAIAQLGYKSGAVYYRGFADSSSDFIEKISCP